MKVSVALLALMVVIAQGQPSSKRMADGKEWLTENLDVRVEPSYCYDDNQENCRKYGRLYTWESAKRACQSLRGGWHLPTVDEWMRMVSQYTTGQPADSPEGRHAAYVALMPGGGSGFEAMLGGGRNSDDGKYARLEAHGLYWTASETAGDPSKAVLGNFGKGSEALYRREGGSKQSGFAVRCVRD